MNELNQKFRREISLSEMVDGVIDIRRYREGHIPVLQIGFNLGKRVITGDLTAVIAPEPVQQTNANILNLK